jgi:hypothetical protein
MSIRSLKRMKRRLIPVLAIAAAIVPTAAQAKPMTDGGSSTSKPIVVRPDDRGARGLVYSQLAHRVSGLDQTRVIPGYNAPATSVSGLDQTRVIPGYNAPQVVSATRPDDRSDRGTFVSQIRQPHVTPVSVSSPGGGFSWGSAGFGVIAGLLAALALAAAAIGLRKQRQHTELAY